jgi:hypothetical protein
LGTETFQDGQMTKSEARQALGVALAREHGVVTAKLSLVALVELALKHGLKGSIP